LPRKQAPVNRSLLEISRNSFAVAENGKGAWRSFRISWFAPSADGQYRYLPDTELGGNYSSKYTLLYIKYQKPLDALTEPVTCSEAQAFEPRCERQRVCSLCSKYLHVHADRLREPGFALPRSSVTHQHCLNPDKRRYRTSGVLVRDLSGYATTRKWAETAVISDDWPSDSNYSRLARDPDTVPGDSYPGTLS